MTGFRTEIKITPSDLPIRLEHPVLTAGSCFADTIGARLKKYKFNTLINPFGVTYNPYSIHSQLKYAVCNEQPPDHGFVDNENIVLHHDFHSRFSALTRNEISKQLSEVILAANHFLRDAQWLMITYGTSWVYVRKETGEIVANCHKMPQHLFAKELLSQKRILDSFDELYREIKRYNSNIRIILTVSPVRHTKDTLELNSVSKSVLRLSCHTITEQYSDVSYFPAYEILLDDLRDYRFYNRDMIHPSEMAEEYIWDKFSGCYFDAETKSFVQKWKEILNAVNHRPFHPSSASHQRFLKNVLKSLDELKSIVNVTQEIAEVKSQLTE